METIREQGLPKKIETSTITKKGKKEEQMDKSAL